MKRNILILFSVFATLCFPARADGIVTFDSKQLPPKARIFLVEHFPEAQISHIKIEKEFLRVSKYEVLLTNRTEVEFDRDGEWLEVECDRMQVPDALIPAYVSEYLGKYFPDAWVRFKQLSYSQAVYPVEIRISGENVGQLRIVSDQIVSMLRAMPEFDMVRTNYNEPLAATRVVLKEDEASRLGVNNLAVETTLAMRYGSGLPITSLWEGDYNLPVVLRGMRADSASSVDLEDELIPVMAGTDAVPLRQVANVEPCWKEGQIVRRNGIYTITVQADP